MGTIRTEKSGEAVREGNVVHLDVSRDSVGASCGLASREDWPAVAGDPDLTQELGGSRSRVGLKLRTFTLRREAEANAGAV
ncbi:unnamed protein product [Parnassius apollo]|uniref:(apollo) hypothetical protein n=1 Tax=Parnassius apollo TaxID=110799 RepID=A0A8S3WW14_PARAO|nr:unnamed protein product [Parnassius apollo]